LATPPFDPFFIFLLYCLLPSIRMQNLRFVSSAIAEILGEGGFKIWKVGHVTQAAPHF